MNKKGGNTDKANDNSSMSDGARFLLGSAFGFFICFVFAMSFVMLGVQSERSLRDTREKLYNTKEEVVTTAPVEYETVSFEYNPSVTTGVEGEHRELLKKLGGEEKYLYIRSNTEYRSALSQLELMGAQIDTNTLDLGSDFFTTGSLILITTERQHLTDFNIRSLTRDENYHIIVRTYKEENSSNTNVVGKAILIKIPNIQPKLIVVDDDSEME